MKSSSSNKSNVSSWGTSQNYVLHFASFCSTSGFSYFLGTGGGGAGEGGGESRGGVKGGGKGKKTGDLYFQLSFSLK